MTGVSKIDINVSKRRVCFIVVEKTQIVVFKNLVNSNKVKLSDCAAKIHPSIKKNKFLNKKIKKYLQNCAKPRNFAASKSQRISIPLRDTKTVC